MKTLESIRSDLKEIRYYYSRKKVFDEAKVITGKINSIESKANTYNLAAQNASPKLYDLYYSLYAQSHTQESLAEALGYTPEYIQMLHKQLLLFLQSTMQAGGD